MARPTDYREEYDQQAYKLCLLGATDKQLANFFDTSEQTINAWKKQFPSFLESLKNGKQIADAEIANSLYERAKGYTHDDVHISNHQGEVLLTPIKKHYPPDTGAAMAWLKNRQPELWRDRRDLDINTTEPVHFHLNFENED